MQAFLISKQNTSTNPSIFIKMACITITCTEQMVYLQRQVLFGDWVLYFPGEKAR